MKKFLFSFLMFMSFFTIPVLATDFNLSIIPSDTQPYRVVTFSSATGNPLYSIIQSDSPIYVSKHSSSSNNNSVFNSDTPIRVVYVNKDTGVSANPSGSIQTDLKATTPIYANHNIIDTFRNPGEVFFSKITQISPTVEAIPMIQEMTRPIRGILPFLIPLVVLLVGFWKGWRFLLQQLRTA